MLRRSNSNMPNLQSRRLSRKARLALFIAVSAAAGPILIWATSKSTAGLPPATGSAETASVPVTAVTVTRRNVPVFLTGLGTVQAFNTVTVKPRVGGQIIDLPFVEGQAIQQGAVVAHIDPRPYAAALRQAQGITAKDEAQLANAELDLTRSTNLAQKGYATTQALDTQKAQVADAAQWFQFLVRELARHFAGAGVPGERELGGREVCVQARVIHDQDAARLQRGNGVAIV